MELFDLPCWRQNSTSVGLICKDTWSPQSTSSELLFGRGVRTDLVLFVPVLAPRNHRRPNHPRPIMNLFRMILSGIQQGSFRNAFPVVHQADENLSGWLSMPSARCFTEETTLVSGWPRFDSQTWSCLSKTLPQKLL